MREQARRCISDTTSWMHSFTQQPAYRLPGQRCVNERHNLLQNSIVLVYIVVVKTMTISIITFCGATTLFGAILCSTIHTPKLQDGAVIVWISASPKWTLCNSHESHETCHSVTFFFHNFHGFTHSRVRMPWAWNFQGPFCQYSRTKNHTAIADFHSNDMFRTRFRSVAKENKLDKFC